MYAIRSYYERPTRIPARRMVAFSLTSSTERMVACAPGMPPTSATEALASPWAASSLSWRRITSYNVCYTKLLRILRRKFISAIISLSSTPELAVLMMKPPLSGRPEAGELLQSRYLILRIRLCRLLQFLLLPGLYPVYRSYSSVK